MPFDPDLYLKKKAASQQPAAPFDPDAYLTAKTAAVPGAPGAPTEDISKVESFLRGGVQGATLGFADEIAGGVESLFTDKTYSQARDESRAAFTAADEANPITSGIGNFAGGMAIPIPGGGAMGVAGKVLGKIPGIGGALAGSTLAKAATMGAGLGGIEGAGRSTADSLGGVLDDAKTSALVGGALGGGSQVALGAVGGAAKAGGRFLMDSFDPTVQRIKAFGGTTANIRKAGGVRAVAEGMDEAKRLVGFSNPDGSHFNPTEFHGAVDSAMDTLGGKMKTLVDGQAYPHVADETILDEFTAPLYTTIMDALPNERAGASKVVQALLQKIDEGSGSIPKLWEMKKYIGAKVNWASNPMNQAPPLEKTIYMEANQLLDGIITKQADEAAKHLKVEGLSELNQSYSKLSKIWSITQAASEKFITEGDTGARIKISDQLKGAGVGAGLGTVIGMTGLGAGAGLVGALGGAALRSTSGRLARAKIGESMGLGQVGQAAKAAGDAAGLQMGMIPRTLKGVRDWMMGNPDKVPPQLAQTVKDIMASPDTAAEIQVRALMPLFDQFITPSPYKSEFNGKITSPQDRVTARSVIMAQGLPPSVAAYHASMLNKSGMLQMYHYAPAKEEGGDYGDQLLNFNQRLTEMGYM